MTHKEAVALLKQHAGSVEIEVAPAADDSSSVDESGDESAPPGYALILCNNDSFT